MIISDPRLIATEVAQAFFNRKDLPIKVSFVYNEAKRNVELVSPKAKEFVTGKGAKWGAPVGASLGVRELPETIFIEHKGNDYIQGIEIHEDGTYQLKRFKLDKVSAFEVLS